MFHVGGIIGQKVTQKGLRLLRDLACAIVLKPSQAVGPKRVIMRHVRHQSRCGAYVRQGVVVPTSQVSLAQSRMIAGLLRFGLDGLGQLRLGFVESLQA